MSPLASSSESTAQALPIDDYPATPRALIDEAVKLLAAPNYIPTSALEEEIHPFTNRLTGHDVYALPSSLTEGKRAAVERAEFDLAADYALAIVRYATMFSRGGTSMYAGFATSLEIHELKWLVDADHVFSDSKLAEVRTTLERSLRERGDLAALRACDRAYDERRGGWEAKLASVLGAMPSTPDGYFYDQMLPLQSTVVVSAIRQYARCRSKFPPDLSALTPDYLACIPVDPFSGKSFIYRPSQTTFVLYSVGRDGIDNGGKFDADKDGYDIDLATLNGRR